MAAKTKFYYGKNEVRQIQDMYGIGYGIEINRQKNSKLSVSAEK